MAAIVPSGDNEPSRPLTAGQLRALLAEVDDLAIIGAFIEGETRGFTVYPGEGFNRREAIFWVRIERGDQS